MSITLGPFAFASVHLIFLLASITALGIAWWLGRRFQHSLSDAVFRIIAVGLVSARAFFVIKYVDTYLATPWQIFNVRDGGFSLWVGLGAGLLWTARELRALHRHSQLTATSEHPLPLKRMQVSVLVALAVGLGVAVSGHLWLNQALKQTQFPQVTLQQLQGQPVNIAQTFYGQPTVLNLWASWCPPCVREMPLLEVAAERWPEVHFVAVNQGEGSAQIMAFLRQQQLNPPVVLLDPSSELGSRLGSHALPTTLFFHRDGSLSHTHIGEFNAATLENAVRQLK